MFPLKSITIKLNPTPEQALYLKRFLEFAHTLDKWIHMLYSSGTKLKSNDIEITLFRLALSSFKQEADIFGQDVLEMLVHDIYMRFWRFKSNGTTTPKESLKDSYPIPTIDFDSRSIVLGNIGRIYTYEVITILPEPLYNTVLTRLNNSSYILTFNYKLSGTDFKRFDNVLALDIDKYNILACSDGFAYPNTEKYNKYILTIKLLEDSLKTKHIGSNMYIKCSERIDELYKHLRNYRMNIIHGISNKFTNELHNTAFVVLDRPRPSINKFSKTTSMYCANVFVTTLEYKCKNKQIPLFKIPPLYLHSYVAMTYDIKLKDVEDYLKSTGTLLDNLVYIGQEILARASS